MKSKTQDPTNAIQEKNNEDLKKGPTTRPTAWDPKFKIPKNRYPTKTKSTKHPKLRSNDRDPKVKIQKQIDQHKKQDLKKKIQK